ncbi:MAG: class I SAM-dependent methyltransferase [Bacteroidales bacterium]|jgi:SAM-dependent methyltransferase|nr:class I SAM-dependent methyltransferase [Bacteroidales bacterium]
MKFSVKNTNWGGGQKNDEKLLPIDTIDNKAFSSFEEKKSYFDIYKQHVGFVSVKSVHYFYIYDMIFSRIIEENKPITLLEIGVQNGGSLEIWEKYLPENSKIYGVDIDKKCCDLKFSDNISFHLGSAVDNDFMNRTFKDIDFDVILDDGSHICKDVIKTFINMFPKLKSGGIYVVEDLGASYWKGRGYGGGFRKSNASIEFFKRLVDALNLDYIPKNKIFKRKQIMALKEYHSIIKQISFYDAICTVSKYKQLKMDSSQSVFTGNMEEVCTTSTYVKSMAKQQDLIEKIKKLYI